MTNVRGRSQAGRLVGTVGVAGLPQGEDDKACRAGIAACEKMRGKK